MSVRRGCGVYRTGLSLLWDKMGKTVAMILGIAFATLLIAQQGAIYVCLMGNAASVIRGAADADIWVYDERADYIDDPGTVPAQMLHTLRSINGVEMAAPMITSRVLLDNERFVEAGALIGIDTSTYLGMPRSVHAGDILNLSATDSFAVNDRGYSKIWPGEEVMIGRTLEVNNRRLRLVAVVEPLSPFSSLPQIYTGMDTAYAVTGKEHPSFFLIRAQNPDRSNLVVNEITKVTGLNASASSEFSRTTIDYYLENTGISTNFMITISLGFIVGMAIVVQTFYLFMIENIKVFGLLKTMGASSVQMVMMTLMQSLIVGGIGLLMGLSLAVLFFDWAAGAISAFRGFYLPWDIVHKTILSILTISILSVLVCLRKVIRLDPALLLRGA